jgi:antagonist of KipI
MTLQVISAGPLTTIQDLGRPGFERFGVPQSGALDWFALWAANRLVGSPSNSAALEFVHQGPQLCPSLDCLVAVAGRGFSLTVGSRRVGAWRCAMVRAGELIQVHAGPESGWGYLAVSGGIDVPLIMGSRSTYLRGGFGGLSGRILQPGDLLPTHAPESPGWQHLAGRSLPSQYRIPYADQVTLPVILGPQADVFAGEGLAVFLSAEYQVAPASDRMGYRLSGPPIPRQTQSELLSEGIAAGSVQVPPDGQPIVLLSDRPATGGYAKIATLPRAALPLLVQAMPGVGRLRFQALDVAAAQEMYRRLIDGLEKGVASDAD